MHKIVYPDFRICMAPVGGADWRPIDSCQAFPDISRIYLSNCLKIICVAPVGGADWRPIDS